MRVMVIIKATKSSEAGEMPSEKLLADMGKYNEELVKAGVMLAQLLFDVSPTPAPVPPPGRLPLPTLMSPLLM